MSLKIKFKAKGSELNPLGLLKSENLILSENTITALVGPNGSGKTTFLKSILLSKESGIEISKDDICASNLTSKEKARIFSFLSPSSSFRPNIRIHEFLNLNHSKNKNQDFTSQLLEKLELVSILPSPLNKLSEGQYRKVFLASCLLEDTPWYFLDEPEEHLDPKSLKHLAEILRQMKSSGKSIFITCHNLHFANAVAERILGIKDGKIIFDLAREDINLHTSLELLFSTALSKDEKNFIL